MRDTMLAVGLVIYGFLSIAAFGFLYVRTDLMAGEILGCFLSFFCFGLVLGMTLAAIGRHYFGK